MKKSKNKIVIVKIGRLAAMIAWIILTFYLCQQNGDGSNALSSGITDVLYSLTSWLPFHLDYVAFHVLVRKLAHFSTHFILAVLVFRAVRVTFDPPLSLRGETLLCLATSGVIALFDEFIQLFAISRTPKFADALINLTGVLLGTFLCRLLLSLKQRRP